MSLPRLPRIEQPVTLDDIEEIVAYLRAITPLVQGGSNVVPHVSEGGTWYEATGGGGVGLLRAQAPSGGIAAGATGTVTLYDADHSLGSDTLDAANRTTNAVASSAMVLVAWMAREGEYQVVNEVCS